MNIKEIKRINKEKGYHFFSKDTMRYFNSRVSSFTKGRYFITSEKMDSLRSGKEYPREYTIRFLRKDGSIETVGELGEFKTLDDAKRMLKTKKIKDI